MFNVKRLVQVLVAAFVVYAIFTSPDRVGDILSSAWGIVVHAVESLGSFFDAVLGRD